MRKISGGLPPRYVGLLRLSLFGTLLQLVPGIPYCLAYFLPLGVWSKLLILFCPLLWGIVVGPARIGYGETVAAFVKDNSAPLAMRSLLDRKRAWKPVFQGRFQLMRGKVLPLFLLSAVLLLPLWLSENVFIALQFILRIFTFIASALWTAIVFIPRLLTGGPLWADAGVLGGLIVLCVLFAASLLWYIWGLFQSGGYRFGYTRLPQYKTLKPLLRKNLLLWLPTIVLFAAFLALSYGEMLLVTANLLNAEMLYSIQLQPLQIILLLLGFLSYFLLMPIRKWNTAVWVQKEY